MNADNGGLVVTPTVEPEETITLSGGITARGMALAFTNQTDFDEDLYAEVMSKKGRKRPASEVLLSLSKIAKLIETSEAAEAAAATALNPSATVEPA